MIKVALTDICDFQGGTQPPKEEWIDHQEQGYIRMLQIRDFTQSEKNNIEYVKDKDNLKKCNENDILIGRYGASVGKILTGLSGAYNVAIIKTIPDTSKVSRRFLFHYLNSSYFQEFIRSVGSRAAQAGFNKDDLKNALIPLYTDEEQRKIAAVLDKVSDLIAKRRQQLKKLDLLVKARFVEMFGDPVYNSKELPTERGIDFFKLSNGKFVPENKRFESGIPAYGGNGISWYTNDSIIQNDTLVVGRVGFQSGNVHFVKGPLWVTDNAMYISYYNAEKYDLQFLYALMEHIDFTRFQDAGDLKKITQKPFMNMEYIRPTLLQQKEYVSFFERTGEVKRTISESLIKLEILKKALMQEYFG